MRVSVLIPTYNRKHVLEQTLPTLFHQDFPADQFELVIVVDGSTDGTVEMLRSLKPRCALQIVEQENQGPAAARNAGLMVAGGDLVLCLDDDICCERDLIKEHALAHEQQRLLLVHGPIFVREKVRRLWLHILLVWHTNNFIADLGVERICRYRKVLT